MKLMNEIQVYSRLLRLRAIFKRIQQLSWNLSKIEQKYDLDQLGEKDLIALVDTYTQYTDELKNIYDELINEQTSKPTK
jgi:hypothetical protein